MKPNSLTQQSSLLKLDYIYEQLASDREGKTNKLRKKAKISGKLVTYPLEIAVSSKSNEDDAVTTTSDHFHFDSLEF